jgi:HK97 family phage prohead protease
MPKPNILSEKEFHESAKAGKLPADAHLRKTFVAEAKAAVDGERIIDFIISTDAIDRMGDTISVDGWQLADYRKNPVVLWAHDSSMPPIAKASNVRVEDGKLKARAEFVTREMSLFGDQIYQMIKGGFLSAVSVGFDPMKWVWSEEDGRTMGIDFTQQELLEFSVVPIPANPEALIEARSAGLDISEIEHWAEKLLRAGNRTVISQEKMNAILALPEEFRTTAKKMPATAKGARGQMLRCANIAERIIKGEAPVLPEVPVEDATGAEPLLPTTEQEIVIESSATPRLDMARRRLSLLELPHD